MSVHLLPTSGYSSYQMLPSSESLRLVHSHDLVSHAYNIVIISAYPEESRMRKAVKRISQGIALLGGFAARIPFISVPLQYAGENKVYGIILVYGNTASYGSVISWCLLKMVNAEFDPLSKQKSSSNDCQRGLLKTFLIGVGLAAQIPFAYMSYVYNHRNIIFPISVFVMDSSFPIYSLMLTSEEIIKRRHLSQVERKLHQFKQLLISRLEINHHTLVSGDAAGRLNYIERLQHIKQLNETPDHQIKEYFAVLLSIAPNAPSTDHWLVRGGRHLLARGTGAAIGLSQLFFLGTLSYLATKEITDNSIACYGVAGFITTCNAYLNMGMVIQTCVKTYDYTIQFFKGQRPTSLASIFYPKLKKALLILGLATVGLSYSGPMQVCQDYYTGNTRITMQALSVIGTIMMAGYAVTDLIEDLINHLALMHSDPHLRQLAEINQEIKRLLTLIDKSPLIEFTQLLNLLPAELIDHWRAKLKLTSENIQEYLETSNLICH